MATASKLLIVQYNAYSMLRRLVWRLATINHTTYHNTRAIQSQGIAAILGTGRPAGFNTRPLSQFSLDAAIGFGGVVAFTTIQ